MFTMARLAPAPKQNAIQENLPIRTPNWGSKSSQAQPENSIKTTWLGHACFLVEFPSRTNATGARGVRLLFDPVFSDRCSPFTFLGPKRFTRTYVHFMVLVLD
jgi:N-acyl-phosphatidylethanolamine-hydrolysing phospholipase D